MDVAERGPHTVEVPAASPLGSFVGNQLNGGVIAGGNVTQIIHNYVPQASAEDMSPLVEGIRDWLNVKVNFRAIHNDVRQKRVGSTGDWLINSPEYQQWKRSRGGVLCGTGIPGAGKTVLMSRVIDDLLPLEESTDRKVCVLFAYNRYTEPLSLCDILKGFVLQVVERHQHLAELVKPIKKRCTSERTEPTSDNLIDLLQAPGIDLTIRCDFKGFTALEQAIWVGWEGVTARIIKFATGWEVKFGRRRRGWKELFYALRSEPERFPPWFVTAMSKRLAMFEGGEEWWRVEIEEESSDESDTE